MRVCTDTGDLRGAEDARPRGGQLNGQRQPVKLTAQPRDGRPVGGTDSVARGARPFAKEPHRLRGILVVSGQAETVHLEDALSRHAQHLPRRGHDGQPRARGEQPLHQFRALGHDLLAVIDYQQRRPRPQVPDHGGRRVLPWGLRHAQGGSHRPRKLFAAGHARQVHPPRALLEPVPRRRGKRDAQPRLAAATGPYQGQQPVRGQRGGEITELTLRATRLVSVTVRLPSASRIAAPSISTKPPLPRVRYQTGERQ
jgi:hypothetical protein